MTFTPVRRQARRTADSGFGYLARSEMLAEAAAPPSGPRPHFRPKAKRVIFLFMQGGVSHVESYDYKPRLQADDGKMMSFDDARVIANTGMRGSSQRVMKPLWKFARHGQSGRWASDLFPEVNRHVDDLCFVHSLHTEGVAHGPATLFLHCGSTTFVHPSSRLSKCSYASGASSRPSSWLTIHDGVAFPPAMRSRSARLYFFTGHWPLPSFCPRNQNSPIVLPKARRVLA